MKKRHYRGTRNRSKGVDAGGRAGDAPVPERTLKRRRRIWMISDLGAAIVVLVVFEVMQKNPVLDQAIRARTPSLVFDLAGSVILGTTATRLFELIFNFKLLITDDEYALRIFRLFAILEALRAAAVALLLVYGTGAIAVGAALLSHVATFLSERASHYISTILGWLASGLIGNFAYDLLKRSVAPRRGRQRSIILPSWRSAPRDRR